MEQLPTTDQRRNSTLHDPTSDGSGQRKRKGKGQKKAKRKGGPGEGVTVWVVWGVIAVCWLLEKVSTPKINVCGR